MAVLERRYHFFQSLYHYITQQQDTAMCTQDDTLYDAICILLQCMRECDTEKDLQKMLRMSRNLLNSKYPLSTLIQTKNRYQVRNHLSQIMQDMEQLWLGTKS